MQEIYNAEERNELLAFYDFPVEHWIRLRLRTTNPIESTFSTVKLPDEGHLRCRRSPRRRSRWCSSSWNLPRPAGARSLAPTWSRWSRAEPRFEDGVLIERDEAFAA